ncbi:hypothetical protein NUW58_g3965 [Xylaria curta]|uniref:Uncharacterized protein n=1 Tax=Xylaria curta TaxID=42375 RepID=A0ACC1PBI7_9PEZI|nr:hypothetical protein NUW58_g3965 [Xylaria curta]
MQFLNIVTVLFLAALGMASAIEAVENRDEDCSCSPTVTVTTSEIVATPYPSDTVTVTVTISTAPGGETGETPTGYGGGDVCLLGWQDGAGFGRDEMEDGEELAGVQRRLELARTILREDEAGSPQWLREENPWFAEFRGNDNGVEDDVASGGTSASDL